MRGPAACACGAAQSCACASRRSSQHHDHLYAGTVRAGHFPVWLGCCQLSRCCARSGPGVCRVCQLTQASGWAQPQMHRVVTTHPALTRQQAPAQSATDSVSLYGWTALPAAGATCAGRHPVLLAGSLSSTTSCCAVPAPVSLAACASCLMCMFVDTVPATTDDRFLREQSRLRWRHGVDTMPPRAFFCTGQPAQAAGACRAGLQVQHARASCASCRASPWLCRAVLMRASPDQRSWFSKLGYVKGEHVTASDDCKAVKAEVVACCPSVWPSLHSQPMLTRAAAGAACAGILCSLQRASQFHIRFC